MSRLAFYFRNAFTHLRHGGQRILVAVLCVAFGVMSLVSMLLLSGALQRMLVQTPHDLIGADISMERRLEDVILPEDVAGLDQAVRDGVLDEYTLVAYTSSLTFHLPDSGELHFPSEGIGIDPAAYPPIGALSVESPHSAELPALLAGEGDVLISRDLALEYDLAVGDSLVLSDLTAGQPLQVSIRGIITDTPNHKGSKLYYSLETAARLAGSERALNTVLATTSDPETARQRLKAAGWNVYLASDLAEVEEQVQDLFATLLNGAGVLGLLVSGVGIANTMQVLLRRRQPEVAVWKSLGYRSDDLLAMFSIEATLLGLVGSLLGAALGILVSHGLVNLFSRTSTMLIRWELSPQPVLLAVLVGVATTLVFALWAIVSTSQVRPVALLRGESVSAAQLPRLQSALLFVALAVPFTLIVGLIMGSLLKAVGVLAAALIGLVLVGGGLGLLLWLAGRLLPLGLFPAMNVARGSLRRRGWAPVFALVALFTGVVALTLSGVVTQNAYRVLDSASLEVEGANLTILAPADQEQAVIRTLEAQDIQNRAVSTTSRVRSVTLASDPTESFSTLLIGQSDPAGYTLTGAQWNSRLEGVYLSTFEQVPVGSVLQVTLWDCSIRELPVVGAYTINMDQSFNNEMGILLPDALSKSITPPEQVQFLLRVPASRLTAMTQALGELLPQATVINLVAYAARFTRNFHNLFLFAVSMAGLALLAGVLLMANSITLAILDRRYEIGVLKAMGYASRHVLGTLMVEYGLIGLVAAGAGLLLVKGFLWLATLNNPLAGSLLALSPEMAAAIGMATLALTLFTVLVVAWKSTRVSPLVVLNERD
jgi:putative ABC transport system permease protein